MYFDQKDYVKHHPKYQPMLACMAKEVEEFVDDFLGEQKDDPRFLSGWGHGYFCDEDGGRLIYNRKNPFSHTCSICGKVYKEYRYSSYFTTMYRNEAVVTTIKAGILYQISGEKKYLEIVQKIIGFYTENYQYFAVHAKDKIDCDPAVDVGGAGKIMPQGLNEAILAIRFIEALELVKEGLDLQWLIWVRDTLFAPLFQLLLPQKNRIHNIPTWIDSAFGVMGLFFNKKEWLEEATEKEFHLYKQIQKGVTESGFWYEGSIHYNFFAMEGIMSFFVFAETYGFAIPEEIRKTVYRMFTAAYEYAFQNDIFPNPSDGWPNLSLQTYSYVYYMGYKVFKKALLPYIHQIEQSKRERGRLPLSEPYYYKNQISLQCLMFGADCMEKESDQLPIRKSKNFAGSNCAILRNSFYNVFLKYGHQTKSHAHPDKMNIEIMVKDQVLTKDLSNSGYASKLCNGWHRTIAAHNTCAVNGKASDLVQAGELIYMTDSEISARAQAYKGVLYTRKILLKGNMIQDVFLVEGKENMMVDWFFHFETPIDRSTLMMQPAKEDSGYAYMEQLQELSCLNKSLKIENDLVEVLIQLEEGARAYLVQTYNNPANQMRDTILIRKYGTQARFEMEITTKDGI